MRYWVVNIFPLWGRTGVNWLPDCACDFEIYCIMEFNPPEVVSFGNHRSGTGHLGPGRVGYPYIPPTG